MMLSELRAQHSEVLDSIRTSGAISDDNEKALSDFLEEFARTFA